MVEKGWLGGGNMARNTTVIRSNYLWDESAAIYEHSLKLWEGLEDDLDYDLLFSQRGVLNLAHTSATSAMRDAARHANRLNGVDAEWLDARRREGVLPDHRTSRPTSATRCSARPCSAAAASRATTRSRGRSRRGRASSASTSSSTARSRGSSAATAARSTGVETTRGPIRAGNVGLAAAGHTSVLAAMVGLRLPLQSHPLQALVSGLHEPVLDCVVMSNAVHVYVSQADKGELVMGAGIDPYNGYAPARLVPRDRAPDGGGGRAVPDLRARPLLRTWAGIVDVCPDASPIVERRRSRACSSTAAGAPAASRRRPASGWVFADTIAHGEPHELARRSRSTGSRPAR